ncbi:MAG: alkaline phosphatase family protein, partial [Desulfobacterales bacterium]
MALHNNNRKILMIGLDLADADLIDRWCEEDYLPNISRLRRQGTWGKLRTSAELMHLSAWPTLHTGTLPGKHGMYHAYQISPGEQDVHRTRADECAQPPFWKFLDDAGKKCIIMDAFMDYPVQGFQGIQIINWGTWTWFSDPQASPEGLWKELNRRFGAYPAPEHSKVLEVPEPGSLLRRLVDGTSVKSKVARWLMKQVDWDIFYLTFAEPHPAGHYLWHYADPDYPSYRPGQHELLANAMRDVYVAVD